MRDALLAGPTLSSNARAKAFCAKVYAKCMSISRRQFANSTAVAAGSRSAGGSKSGLALYVGAWVPAKTWAALVMLPGMAFQTASVAIKVIAPVVKPLDKPLDNLCAWAIREGKLERHRRCKSGGERHG